MLRYVKSRYVTLRHVASRWSKNLMELTFTCGEFLWIPEDPVCQIHSPHPHVGAPGIICDLVRSVHMLKREREREGCGEQREATAPIQSLVKLQAWFVSLQWKTCLRQNYRLGSCVCSEGPALGQNTRWWWWYTYYRLYRPIYAICRKRKREAITFGKSIQ